MSMVSVDDGNGSHSGGRSQDNTTENVNRIVMTMMRRRIMMMMVL